MSLLSRAGKGMISLSSNLDHHYTHLDIFSNLDQGTRILVLISSPYEQRHTIYHYIGESQWLV